MEDNTQQTTAVNTSETPKVASEIKQPPDVDVGEIVRNIQRTDAANKVNGWLKNNISEKSAEFSSSNYSSQRFSHSYPAQATITESQPVTHSHTIFSGPKGDQGVQGPAGKDYGSFFGYGTGGL